MLTRTCSNCKFIYANEQHQTYCRRYPPTVLVPEWVRLSEQSFVPMVISGTLPPVQSSATCGEHRFNLTKIFGGVK